MPETTDPSSTLAGIREREQAATAGPWEVHSSKAIGIRLASDETDWPLAEGFRHAADAEFAAVARTAVPRLLAALDAVLKLADSAKEVRDYSGYETHGRLVGWRGTSPAALREAITSALTGEGT